MLSVITWAWYPTNPVVPVREVAPLLAEGRRLWIPVDS